jgi:hypothetical protein
VLSMIDGSIHAVERTASQPTGRVGEEQMPFTPIHMGPGMAVKAAMPRHFSIVVFGLTQIVIDVEVLWQLAIGGYPLHRFCHTYLGRTHADAVRSDGSGPGGHQVDRDRQVVAPVGLVELLDSAPLRAIIAFVQGTRR